MSTSPMVGDVQISDKVIDDHLAVQGIIRAYQARGHLVAALDPLGIDREALKDRPPTTLPSRTVVRSYVDAFGEEDMERSFKLPMSTYVGGKERQLPLKEIIQRLENAYCRSIGVEFMFINSLEQCNWIRQKFESPGVMTMDSMEKRLLLARLTRSHGFEAFLARKFSSEKRFGLEGCEILIPAMKQVIDRSTSLGVESFVMGMPHRGRLNVLANVCRKPLEHIFTQFAGLESADEGSGDVKYHLGTYQERLNRVTNKNIRLAIVANPSHLEACDPVVQGKTRAEQFYHGDSEGKKVLSILLHGDAAFSGQGIVYETFHLSELPEYTTHGTIHIVVNNQIGFTTDPRMSRSSPYCTDVARVVNAPIFHVNADDPEAVMHVCNVAADWRSTFHKDVVIDLVCYRRNGHNEIDEPMFTQPLMYTRIRKLKPVIELYGDKLINEGVVTPEEVKEVKDKYEKILETAFSVAKQETQVFNKHWIDSPWSGFFEGKDPLKISPTGVHEDTLKHIGKKFSSAPPNASDFVIHRGIQRILNSRMEMVESRTADWALGEAMAFGSLLKEGTHVRLSGQDVERGTFSHRHHVLHHQKAFKDTSMLIVKVVHLVVDSVLYGVSLTDVLLCVSNTSMILDMLHHYVSVLIWVYSATIVQTLMSLSVLQNFFLCHILDLPQHCLTFLDDKNFLSILLKCDYDQYFDCSLNIKVLSLALCYKDRLESVFTLMYPEAGPASNNPANVKRLIFCSGRVYYDLVQARKEAGLEEKIAIARVEQIAPFPYDLVMKECAKYADAELVWSQEEHKNMGAWSYIQPRISTALNHERHISSKRVKVAHDSEDQSWYEYWFPWFFPSSGTPESPAPSQVHVASKPIRPVRYAGRPVSASPATGNKKTHIRESKQLLEDSLAL
ncbi:2-oxoglutarate dehydrogenase, mitochondrial-like [Penaeus monodon]|uniref:2-oxoglutarate dehydrogenase, mitochondrial-like n=1 Tax=Penaeus monodon TaxID=6687 RepID=UPI0018A70B45|nr:2-oxoglutarate dehydrogenase, mitochondrial-like [Penaeus monodon]